MEINEELIKTFTYIFEEINEIKTLLGQPEFWNKSKIASHWGYSNQNQLKEWQLPDFGIPAYFNGKSPMFRIIDVKRISINPEHYKQKWNRLTVKEKQEIRAKFQMLKQQEVILCH